MIIKIPHFFIIASVLMWVCVFFVFLFVFVAIYWSTNLEFKRQVFYNYIDISIYVSYRKNRSLNRNLFIYISLFQASSLLSCVEKHGKCFIFLLKLIKNSVKYFLLKRILIFTIYCLLYM